MSGPIRPPLRVREQDGSPNVRPVNTIKVTNGTLTDDGNAVVSVQTGSGGGGDTYSISAGQTGSDAELLLDAATGSDSSVKLAAGSNVTLTVSGGDTITIDSTQASAANPSATVSGTATNGTASTFMRSDAAPALANTTVTAGSYTYSSITVDAQGRLTAASSGTAPAVDGSGASTQVTYWSDADTITGSNNLTFDGTNLDVAGYVKSGTGFYDTDGTTDLTLQTNGGTNSGTIVIRDGVGQDIEITPNGSGSITLDGLKWPNADGSANQVLQTDGAGTLSFADAGGGGGGTIGGSISEDQVAVGATTANEIEGSAGFTAALGGSGSVSVLKFGLSDGTTNYTRLRLNGTNAYVEFRDASDNQKGAIGFQSTQGLKFYSKAGGLGATEALRITPDDEWMLNGTNTGTSGQVLTSGGSGAAVSWADASGGGSGFVAPQMGTGTFLSTYDAYYMNAAPYGVGAVENEAYTDYQEYGIYRPMVMPEGGTWGGVEIQVSSASTSNALLVSLYESDSTTGMPTSFVGYCEVATTSTGAVAQTTTLNSSGSSATISLTAAKQYWVAVVAKSNSDSFSLSCAKTEALSPLSATNMGSQFTVARNIFVDNNIETNNPPRINQLLERNFPLVGVIIS